MGSTSTARTTTYLTAAAVYATEDMLSANASTLYGGGGFDNYSSVVFQYLVAADDETVDLRQVGSRCLCPAGIPFPTAVVVKPSTLPLTSKSTTAATTEEPIYGKHGDIRTALFLGRDVLCRLHALLVPFFFFNTGRYLDSSSLVGSIRRLSSNPLAVADLSLPQPGTNGSLSHNADIVVDAANQVSQWKHLLLLKSQYFYCWHVPPMMRTTAVCVCGGMSLSMRWILCSGPKKSPHENQVRHNYPSSELVRACSPLLILSKDMVSLSTYGHMMRPRVKGDAFSSIVNRRHYSTGPTQALAAVLHASP